MKINSEGLELIKSFEGCRLKAYKCPAGVWTIGYGHTAGVKEGDVITQSQADEFLKSDMAKYEGYVEKHCSELNLNDNQFSALVSFCYNCGVGNLQMLVRNRTVTQIAEAIVRYNKANGRVLNGLVRRRKAEQELFTKGMTFVNPYREPNYNIRRNSKGDGVRWVQWQLKDKGYKLSVDGIAGANTDKAIRDFQAKNGLVVDGVVGRLTRAKLK